MNDIVEQLRMNAKAAMVPHARENLPAAAIAGCLEMAADEIERMREEDANSDRVIARGGRLLTGVVNAIRGENPWVLWSHHDAPELARKAMAVVHQARVVLGDYDTTLRLAAAQGDADDSAKDPVIERLRETLYAMPQRQRVCEDCGGEGQAMQMKCYGGPPIEVMEKCEDCKGAGFIDEGPLTDPGVALPGWKTVSRKAERGEALTPIEAFIMRLSPGDAEREKDFRRMLRAALDSVQVAK